MADYFGTSVSVSNNYLAVGASFISSVYIYGPTFLDIQETQEEFKSLAVYPNPSSSSIQVERAGNYQIIDVRGKIVLQGKVRANQPINVNQLSTGLYVLMLSNKTEKYLTKFVKTE